MEVTVFSKMLVARHSPKNKCFAEEGTILFVTPLRSVSPRRSHVRQYFVSTGDKTTKSRYGWVVETPPFTLDDFIRDLVEWLGKNPGATQESV